MFNFVLHWLLILEVIKVVYSKNSIGYLPSQELFKPFSQFNSNTTEKINNIYIESTTELDEEIDEISTTVTPYLPNKEVLIGLSHLFVLKCSNPTTKTLIQTFENDSEIVNIIDLTKKIGIIIHGWEATATGPGDKELADDWIKYRDDNVCTLDWSTLSYGNYKDVARQNTRMVATYLSTFLQNLNTNYNYPFENVILVGHSLGAHISGFVGRDFNGLIGRIFALDPAGPLFNYPLYVPPNARLTSDDALFVQALHTSAGFTGIAKTIGKQDIFINGGTVPQPGCVWPFLVDNIGNDPVSCSHSRSMQYFRDSIRPGYSCRIIKCSNFLQYKMRMCGPVTDTLGFDTKEYPGLFFMVTDTKPVCNGKYYLL